MQYWSRSRCTSEGPGEVGRGDRVEGFDHRVELVLGHVDETAGGEPFEYCKRQPQRDARERRVGGRVGEQVAERCERAVEEARLELREACVQGGIGTRGDGELQPGL